MTNRTSGFGWFLALFAVFLVAAVILQPAPPPDPAEMARIEARLATGGAPTLEDILARQNGETVSNDYRKINIGSPEQAAAMSSQLGTLGGASDPDLWRALRFDEADIRVSAGGDVAKTLVQDGGMTWYEFREGPLITYGGWLLLGTIAVLAIFYLIRGRVRVDGEMTGRTVERFQFVERAAHWTLAASFILLGVTGLLTLMGRKFIAPHLGLETNALLLTWSKLIHNNVAWAFMLALVVVFVMWVWHNIPDRTDIVWFKQAGGIIGHEHPPAKKFNAGQKVIFWSVILLGGSISLSGLSLLFPFDMPLFAKTFAIINDIGVPGWFGYDPLPVSLAPQEEMQLAQAWHAIVAFVLMAIIIGHIYIGTLGMEGAFDAMGSGEVDEAWAHQHHSIWLDEVKAREKEAPRGATPAE
ncbi:formate dehydrogenase subunit gamma [Marinibacterium profundimaris]|uniref:Formate dehydrogenase n=1 Tax=Marinibacterium profundimaris TaxID=1679460 RepID=A0A225NKP3_9RHOB|nr:formate dehydrogenase subunit gamma [Marinibacterium profundimaris]OWU74758.1 formate dehydrogenase [Marinibacterium profundimaris]